MKVNDDDDDEEEEEEEEEDGAILGTAFALHTRNGSIDSERGRGRERTFMYSQADRDRAGQERLFAASVQLRFV